MRAATLNVTDGLLANNQVVGGMGIGFGGGIFNLGSVSIAASTFDGNVALGGLEDLVIGQGGQGGAIDNQNNGTVTITGSAFTNNQAEQGQATYGIGGAIDSENGTSLTVNDSTFTANTATGSVFGSGGAVFSYAGSMAFSNCSFAANQVGSAGFSDGGALEDQAGPATLTRCTFTDNQDLGTEGASTGAAAVSNVLQGAQMTMTDCTLSGNVSKAGDGADGVNTFGQGQRRRFHLQWLSGRADPHGLHHCQQCGPRRQPGQQQRRSHPRLRLCRPGLRGRRVQLFRLGTQHQRQHDRGQSGHFGKQLGRSWRHCLRGRHRQRYGHHAQRLEHLLPRQSGGRRRGRRRFSGRYRSRRSAIIAQNSTTATVNNCLFAHNDAVGGAGGSGGVGGNALGGAIVVGRGVGLFSFADTTTLAINNSLLTGNTAQGGAGGVGANGGNGMGAGIFLGQLEGGPSAASLDATNTLITLDEAVGGVGGSGANGGNGLGGGFYASAGSTACLQQSTLAGNLAFGGQGGAAGTDGQGIGGGVYVESGALVGKTGTLIFGNLASTSNDNTYGVVSSPC